MFYGRRGSGENLPLRAFFRRPDSGLCCFTHSALQLPDFRRSAVFFLTGRKTKKTFNYVDLSTVCHNFISQSESRDFVLYYFGSQYIWNLFPEKSREKVKQKMTGMAAKYRKKHPDKNLKVMFWPRSALTGFQGMNNYDPLFGETFFNDSFHNGILHEDLLRGIQCRTVFMKARTDTTEDGILMAALSEEDLERVAGLIADCEVIRFDCGHGFTQKILRNL